RARERLPRASRGGARRRLVALPARRDGGRLAAGGEHEVLGRRVKVLFVVTRFPAPPRRGDQLRAWHHLRLLAARHRITCWAVVLEAPGLDACAAVERLGVHVEVVALGRAGTVPALARALVGDGRPLQALLFARPAALARVARLAADADVVHAQLVRAAACLP